MATWARIVPVLVILAAARVCLASNIEDYTLEKITVAGAGREYIRAHDEAGAKAEYATGTGRFFDSKGRRIKPDDDLRRDDVLFVVYRATDPTRTVLTGVLKPLEAGFQRATESAPTASGRRLILANGASLALAGGWRDTSDSDSESVTFSTTGRVSVMNIAVRETQMGSTEDLLDWQRDTAPDKWGICSHELLVLNQLEFAHQQAVTLFQWDRGFEWVNQRTGERTPAASPLHELNFVDRFAFRTTEGKYLEALSYIPAVEYAVRIKDVKAMVATLRLVSTQ